MEGPSARLLLAAPGALNPASGCGEGSQQGSLYSKRRTKPAPTDSTGTAFEQPENSPFQQCSCSVFTVRSRGWVLRNAVAVPLLPPLLPVGRCFLAHFSKEAVQTQCQPRPGVDAGARGLWTVFVNGGAVWAHWRRSDSVAGATETVRVQGSLAPRVLDSLWHLFTVPELPASKGGRSLWQHFLIGNPQI